MSGERQNDLGRALRALRIASDKTAETVARRASMSPAKLSKIENGKTLPSVQDVDLILTALGISDEAKAEFPFRDHHSRSEGRKSLRLDILQI